MVTSTGWGTSTMVVSPTWRSPSSAAPRLMTTSPGASGARPSASSVGLRSGSVDPVAGGAGAGRPCRRRSPSAPSIVAVAARSTGAAASTPATAATLVGQRRRRAAAGPEVVAGCSTSSWVSAAHDERRCRRWRRRTGRRSWRAAVSPEHEGAGEEGDAEDDGEGGGDEAAACGPARPEQAMREHGQLPETCFDPIEHPIRRSGRPCGRRCGRRRGTAAVVGVAGGHRVVGDHDDGLAQLAAPPARAGRGPRRRSGSRGCRWARRRRRCRGRLARARATATRCCWPPDSSLGRWCSRSPRPTVAMILVEPAVVVGRCAPARRAGSVMFSAAVSVGSRLNDWNTKPMRSRRSSVRPLCR